MPTYANPHHLSLQDTRKLFYAYLDGLGHVAKQVQSIDAQQLETALANTNSTAFKIIHPLLIQGYRMPYPRYKETPVIPIGLDIETDAKTGQPKLLGFWYPQINEYSYIFNPDLTQLFKVVKGLINNSPNHNLMVWGNLDIQCLIRMFAPNESERLYLSRGMGANIKKGEIIGSPPVSRTIGKATFFIAHYIPGRSLKLGYIDDGRDYSIWVFNASQFYPGTIAQTARGLGMPWIDFARNTHIIDWYKFALNPEYRKIVIASNRQDAITVSSLAESLQARFYDVFKCYPALLVSTGSLTDAAVSKLLSSKPDDYRSNSWSWLVRNVWQDVPAETISAAETLLAETFSAGYVDQFAIGYFPSACTADIAAAYPHKIRSLPDLRHATLRAGKGALEADITAAINDGLEIESAIIRGRVTIPDTLQFHPITIKTFNRENYRPVGTFYASYTLEERRFCESYGAIFTSEEYVIVALHRRVNAPIARVSTQLGDFRTTLLDKLANSTDSDTRMLLDGQQYLVKVIDNSIYGKTVMTIEVVEDIDGVPQITGYIAGDRFNMLYGSLITARTRIQIAEACMTIKANGGQPILTMTDSIYWNGEPWQLPERLIRTSKTPGYFESVEIVEDFFILKTGQYEYRKANKWSFKKRGLNLAFDSVSGKDSFFRTSVIKAAKSLPRTALARDVEIPVHTRKLITVGSVDIAKLAAIEDGITILKPYSLSSKQAERYVTQWRRTINGAIWLRTPKIQPKPEDKSSQAYPLQFLRKVYEYNASSYEITRMEKYRIRTRTKSAMLDDRKRLFILIASKSTRLPPPPGRAFRLPWETLEAYYGQKRNDLMPPGTLPDAHRENT
jgi:hypothetical protein